MQLAQLLTENNAIIFILLFSRISGIMAFFPFFSHSAISISIKSAIAIFLTFFFFEVATVVDIESWSIGKLFILVLSEFALGFIAGLVLNIIFGALGLAGMQISMVMGFSMATVMDPTTQTNSPIVAQFLTLLALLTLLAFNGHHLILLFLSQSIDHISLGAFYPQEYMAKYLIEAIGKMFMLGFIISFPIIALSLLSDVIFGMLMKTMPQFNLLVVGFPIKIFLSILVLISILGAMMGVFEDQFLNFFSFLKRFL